MKFSFFVFVGLVSLWLNPLTVQAATTYVKEIDYRLEQPFGGEDRITSLAQYIQTIYQFALGIVGIIAVVLIMAGGLRWVVAAGNESAIGEAKQMIVSAVTGLAIALLSYIILLTISPQLVTLQFATPKIPIPKGNYIWKLQWCKDAPFKGNSCEASGAALQCELVPCGDTGSYKGGLCRGAVCDDGTGKPGCYHDVVNPGGAATCQLQTCGKRVDYCYRNFHEDEEIEEYKKCLCGYYEDVVMPLMGASGDPTSYSTDQAAVFSTFCSERSSQEKLVNNIIEDVTTSKNYYGFKLGVAVVPNYGYDCNFGCRYVEAAGTAFFDSVATRTVECRPL